MANQEDQREYGRRDEAERKYPDGDGTETGGERTLLIARLRAHLLSGEALELIPLKHEEDVKSEVNALMESWARSGFLLHGRRIYPWHQVARIEVLEVEELPRREGYQRLEELYAADRARLEESFWKTKRSSEGHEGSGAGDRTDSGRKTGDAKDKDESSAR